MDIVYIIGNHSEWAYNELKYSIRSVEMHGDKAGNLVIVGHLPDFLNKESLVHIPVADLSKFPAVNIKNKVLAACNSKQVSNSFLYLHDDHFFTEPFSVDKFPNYCSGTIPEYLQKANKFGHYTKVIHNTLAALQAKGLTETFFNVHGPMVLNKRKVISLSKQFDFNVPFGLAIKSIYGNACKVETIERKDCKFHWPKYRSEIMKQIKGFTFFSTGNAISQDLRDMFKNWFPNKSRWEK